jgi:hypothetical protein
VLVPVPRLHADCESGVDSAPTYVLQCDVGATPDTGFAIGCDGTLSFNGQTTFYECENGIGDEVNLYSKPDMGAMCGAITFTADSCRAACPSTSSKCAAPVTQTVTVTETVSVSFCPVPVVSISTTSLAPVTHVCETCGLTTTTAPPVQESVSTTTSTVAPPSPPVSTTPGTTTYLSS